MRQSRPYLGIDPALSLFYNAGEMTPLRFLFPALFAFAASCPGAFGAASAAAAVDEDGIPIAQEVEDEIVETVKLGGEKQDSTASGEEEGVSNAPEDSTPVAPPPSYIPSPPIILPPSDNSKPIDSSAFDPSRETFASTRKNARTMSMLIPAPPGQITDRNGISLARSIVAYQPAIRFGQQEDESDGHILSLARNALSGMEACGIKPFEFKDSQILSQYKHRRWLPLPVGPVMREAEAERVRSRIESIPAAELQALYLRSYPEKESAGHITGYRGVQSKLPTGPINHNDPIFEFYEGRSGLEKEFDRQLTGRPGVWRLMFNENGRKILDELQVHPKPGGTVVTTLNQKWQRLAQKTLGKLTRRGALVVIDCRTGEILVLVSNPSFDPNLFVPSISQKDYDALRDDPGTPLVSRAIAGVYPPASTFKTMTIAAALHAGAIDEHTIIDCPYAVSIGNHLFKNHSKRPVGSINCVQALALSNNPFMYKTSLKIGANTILTTARRFGYGKRTGIPLPDKPGLVPDEAWMRRTFGRSFKDGDGANLAIGQGALLATPLQVAHAMAGIANGTYLPKLQLIRQVLDVDGNVVYQFSPEIESNLADMADANAIVRKGMRAVIDGGTGHRAGLSYTTSSGKTGTAQWGKESEERRLAWFAGFLPSENPRYAYAALYEGRPHERIGGGQTAAAIVKTFFEGIKADVKAVIEQDKKDDAETAKAVDPDATDPGEPATNKKTNSPVSEWDDGRNVSPDSLYDRSSFTPGDDSTD